MDKWLIDNIGWLLAAALVLLVGVKLAAMYWFRRLGARPDTD
jgi:hypothetical protein